MRRRLWLALVLLATGVALPAGMAHSADSSEARKGGTLRVSFLVDVDYVDPALAYFPPAWMFEYATCAMLFNYPDKSGAAGARVIPEVARKYTVSRDGRTYTFDLRRTFRFHTGAEVTAKSFADTLNRLAQPKLRSPATAYMHDIVGATAVIEGKAQKISGVRVLGRYRLRLRLTKPVGDLTARLTMPFFCPILPNTSVDPRGIDNPPGSGPYYVAERIPNQRVVLRRNPHYRGDRPANVDRVIVTSETAEDCLRGVEQNRIDSCQFGIASSIPLLAAKYGINRPGGRFFFANPTLNPTLETRFVAFNHARPAFDGPGQIPLKKAINHALDRAEVARALHLPSGSGTDQLLPAALGRPASIYPTVGADYAAARRLFAQATRRPTTRVLYADNAPTGVAVARTIVSNLKQIGIEVKVKHFDFTVLPEKVAASGEPFDLALGGWIADYPDPATFFVPLLANGSRVWGINLDDPRINRRIEAANRLRGEARRNAWADLDVDLMRENPPWAPLVYHGYPIFVSQSTGCVVAHPVYLFDIAAACKK